MKLGKIVIVVAMMGMCLALGTASVVAANGSNATTASAPVAASASQLIDEAKKLYAAHDYQAALKRLQAVKTGDLNFLEKAFVYDPLLAKTEKAIPAKAADEKALVDGNDAFGKGRFATAVENLSQAADSDYLTTEQTTQAKAVLLKAQDGLKTSNEKASTLISQAKAALKEGNVADARKAVDQVTAMDVKLGWMDKAALSDVQGKVADAEKAAKAPACRRGSQAGREAGRPQPGRTRRSGQAVGQGPDGRGQETLRRPEVRRRPDAPEVDQHRRPEFLRQGLYV